jgi:hypothetical protein
LHRIPGKATSRFNQFLRLRGRPQPINAIILRSSVVG